MQIYRSTIISFLVLLFFKKKNKPLNILIHRPGAFGDSIVALPALSMIRHTYPESTIDLASTSISGITIADILKKDSLVDQIYLVKNEDRSKVFRELKNKRYDLYIELPQNYNLYKSIRNIFIVRFYLDIHSAFGWDYGRIKSFMAAQKKYLEVPNETHRFIKTLNKHGIAGSLDFPVLKKPVYGKDVNVLLKNKDAIAFLVGGKLQPKKWPLDYWIRLADLIGNSIKILVLGGENDKEDAAYICAYAENIENLCGKFSIAELAYVLSNIKIAVALDTGAMHLCYAVGTPVVALFSTRDLSDKWHPPKRGNKVIEKTIECSFCLKTTCSNNICMTSILPEEVYDSLSQLNNP